MAKIIFLLLVVIAGVLAWRIAAQRARARDVEAPRPAQRIVRCAECDVHLPEDEAIAESGRHFCGRAHLEAFNDRAAGSR